MIDLILELFRALAVSAIFIYLWFVGRKEAIHQQDGWLYILVGFATILFGMLIDITDNFPNLSRYIIIGDTEYQAILEKIFGYLLGFVLLAIGFWKWMPTIIQLKETQRELKQSHVLLELKVKERTASLESEIEDRKRVEETLRKSEEQFRNVYNTAPLAFVVWDRNTRIFDWNEKAEEVFGWSKKEVVGRSFFDFLIPEKDRPDVEDVVDSLKKNDLFRHSINDNLTKEGKIIICEWNNSLLHDDDGNMIGAISLGLDITEREQAEDALRKSEERMEALLYSIPVGIMIIDQETHEIVSANPKATLMIDAPLEQFLGSQCHNFICPSEKGKCPITDLGQSVENSECELLNAYGESIPILKTVIPFNIDDRKLFIECFVDITDHKKAEMELRQQEKLQGVIEMAGGACHELNQPMQTILGRSEIIMMNLEDDNPLYDNIRSIKQQITKLGEITKNLMTITRYETTDYLNGKIIDIAKATK